MTREAIIARLTELGFAKEIVEPVVNELTDDQLVRAKEDSLGDWFKELIETAKAADKEGEPKTVSVGKEGLVSCYKCGARMRVHAGQNKETGAVEIELGEEFMEALGALFDGKLKEIAMPSDIEVELPGVEERFAAIETAIGEIMTVVKEIAKSEEERLAERNKELSDASRSRLTFRFRETPPEEETPKLPDPSAVAIPTLDGKVVAGLGEYMGVEGGP